MTGQERDFEEILSRVLHTATDQVEPVGDGLTKIRARLTEPWLKRQWWLLRSELVVVGWLVAVRCESFLATVRAASAVSADAAGDAGTGPEAGTAEGTAHHGWLQPVLGPLTAWTAGSRLARAGAPLRRSVGPAMAWLRPALAVAGAVVLVVAAVFAVGPMRVAFQGLESVTGAGAPDSTNGGNGNPNGDGAAVPAKAGTPTQGRSSKAGAGSTSRGKADPSPSACSSPSNVPSSSPSPTPTTPSPTPTTPSPTPTTPSPTPTTPSPTATITNGPAGSPMVAGAHHWSIRTTALVVCQPRAQASPTNQATTGA